MCSLAKLLSTWSIQGHASQTRLERWTCRFWDSPGCISPHIGLCIGKGNNEDIKMCRQQWMTVLVLTHQAVMRGSKGGLGKAAGDRVTKKVIRRSKGGLGEAAGDRAAKKSSGQIKGMPRGSSGGRAKKVVRSNQSEAYGNQQGIESPRRSSRQIKGRLRPAGWG